MNKLEIKAMCMDWLRDAWKEAPIEERTEFRMCDEDDLIMYHMSLGMDMRNDNKLWTHQETIGHPDDFSMEVIHSFWEELRGL